MRRCRNERYRGQSHVELRDKDPLSKRAWKTTTQVGRAPAFDSYSACQACWIGVSAHLFAHIKANGLADQALCSRTVLFSPCLLRGRP